MELMKFTSKWANSELSVSARASVCTIFLVMKLFYVIQILHCTRSNIQNLHRISELFIWQSGSEPMRGDNHSRSVKSDRLGNTHLFLSQVVSRFVFLRDQRNQFLRTVLQMKLARFLLNGLVSTHDNYMTRLVGFYKEIVEYSPF